MEKCSEHSIESHEQHRKYIFWEPNAR